MAVKPKSDQIRRIPEALINNMSESEIRSELTSGNLDNETLQAFCCRLLEINDDLQCKMSMR